MAREQQLKGKEILEREQRLEAYAGRDRIVSSHELAKEQREEVDTSYKLPTGLRSLDRLLGGGVEAGNLIVVTGPTGEGKTTLLMSITKNMAEAAINSVWFTLEVTARQFFKKLLKASGNDETKLPLFYLPHANIEDADDDYVREWEKKRRRKYETIDWIEDKIIEAKVKVERGDSPLRVVFIDHIHAVFSISKMRQNLSLEIGDMVQRIKDIALTHNLVVFLIAHSKDPAEGNKREPRKQDIRDSGMISRIADDIVGVWRIKNENDGTKKMLEDIDETDRKAKIRVFKNRGEGTQGYFTAYHENHYLSEGADFDDFKTPAPSDPPPSGRKDHGTEW